MTDENVPETQENPNTTTTPEPEPVEPIDNGECAVCGKPDPTDYDVSPGWLELVVTKGGTDEDEEADAVVCSIECAKAWLDQTW